MTRAMLMCAALAVLMGAPQLAVAADGKAVYDKFCAACHDVGVKNAPKPGDKARWATLGKKGEAALVASVIKGKSVMQARAGTTLPDADIKAVVEYLLAQAE